MCWFCFLGFFRSYLNTGPYIFPSNIRSNKNDVKPDIVLLSARIVLV